MHCLAGHFAVHGESPQAFFSVEHSEVVKWLVFELVVCVLSDSFEKTPVLVLLIWGTPRTFLFKVSPPCSAKGC